MEFNIKENKYDFKIEDLIEMGKRTNNPKRNFLFISKLLGKHLIVKPDVVKASGLLLASLMYPEIDVQNIVAFIKGNPVDIGNELMQESNESQNTLVIGFAETATGLGMAVASAIKDCTYQTTTREPIIGMTNLLSFEEEHSHATTHQCFSILDNDFNNYDEIVLVDDEITTGKTMLNLIKEIKKISNVKKFSIVSILDWRTKEYLDMYEDYLKDNTDIDLKVYSVMSGDVYSDDKTVYVDNVVIPVIKNTANVIDIETLDRISLNTKYGKKKYFKNSGRFGVKQSNIKLIENKAEIISKKIQKKPDEKILVIGHGENTYIPSRVASYLNADYRTTTRSPIFCDGAIIKTKHSFVDRDVTYYLYNKEYIEENYDRVILLTETELTNNLFENVEIYNI